MKKNAVVCSLLIAACLLLPVCENPWIMEITEHMYRETGGGGPTFTVTFITNGGNSIPPMNVAQGSDFTPPGATHNLSGYYGFSGWYTDADLSENWGGGS